MRSALIFALFVMVFTPWTASVCAAQSSGRWYDLYQQGIAAVRKGDWANAEKLLLQAKGSGQKPGRRVFTYGDNYIAFLPDYYLGVVYLNTGRNLEAENSFKVVRDTNVIGAKDPEYAAFDRQAREAIFNRAFGEAVSASQSGNVTVANARLAEARATSFNNAKVDMLSKEIVELSAKNTPPPKPTPDQTVQVQPAPPPLTGGSVIPPAVTTNPVVRPGTVVSGAGTRPGNATVANQGVVQQPKGPSSPVPPLQISTSLREGVLAFFDGDYGGAIQRLQNATKEPGAPPRAQVLLACAKVGLVLVGGGDAAMLRQAQTDFQSANLQQYLTAADRRFISPKILQQLERR
jgi:hypothetical protein